MTVGICGLGLIGGSLAKAYKLSGAKVLGFDTNEGICTLAMADGAIDGLLTDETIRECELVLVAVYPILSVFDPVIFLLIELIHQLNGLVQVFESLRAHLFHAQNFLMLSECFQPFRLIFIELHRETSPLLN